jgi:hypothetical protein
MTAASFGNSSVDQATLQNSIIHGFEVSRFQKVSQ